MNDDEPRGALGAARALLGKVVHKVVDAAFGAGSLAAPPTKPPATEPSSPKSQEPIPTRTMAGLLLAQGHRDRALAIYDHLIEADPDDASLRSEAEALRREPHAVDPKSPKSANSVDGPDSPKGPKSADAPVVAVAAGKNRLFLSWQLSTGALDRARRVLGEEGELRVRVMVTAPNPDEIVGTRTVEHGGIAEVGDWVMSAPPGALCTAAVGVAKGERFVSAAHAPPIAI